MTEPDKQQSLRHACLAATIVACIAFAWASNRRLWHSDLWAHLSYGRLIAQQQALPDFEPFMPLAADEPMRASAWGSQVLAFATWNAFEHHGLQVLYGLAIALACSLLYLTVFLRTNSLFWSLLGTLVFVLVGRHQLAIIRPQLAGIACFLATCCVLQSKRPTLRHIAAIGALFIVWANLHPSFPAGLILLAAYFVAEFLSKDRDAHRLRHLFAFGITAGLAVLMNPFGIGLYYEVFEVSGNPNLRDLLDWRPLSLARPQGQTALTTAIVAAGLMIRSGNRRLVDVGLLVIAGVASAASSRMLNWWAPLVGIAIGTYGAELPIRVGWMPRVSTRAITISAVLALAIAVVFSPVSRVAGLRPRLSLSDTVSITTPIEPVQFINQNPSAGRIFTPNTWGDYVVWTRAGEANVLVTSHVHLVPRAVWTDYIRISHGSAEALELLDDYEIDTAITNPARRGLNRLLHESDEWTPVFDNKRSKVFRRTPRDKKGLPNGSP